VTEALARALARADLDVLGRLPDASNVALLCRVPAEGGDHRCVYKPAAGERRLWDFPGTALAAREVLTARIAAALRWDLLPVTVWREAGPMGPGMCQEWVDEQGPAPVGLFPPEALPLGWRPIAEGRSGRGLVVLAHEDSADLRRMVVLDDLVNNGDRKGGHVLRRADGRLAGIDHGVTLHAEPKLRTVLWGWAGDPVPEWLLAEVRAGRDAVLGALEGSDPVLAAAALSRRERGAAARRLRRLLDEGTFALPGADWPALPWPPM